MSQHRLERTLWTRRVGRPERWSPVARYLTNKLGVFLGLEVVLEAPSVVGHDGFAFGIRGRRPIAGALSLEWAGTLRRVTIEGEIQVTASLVLFSTRRQLQVTGHQGSSFELLYEPLEGAGQWCVLGWHDDIYGEYVGAGP